MVKRVVTLFRTVLPRLVSYYRSDSCQLNSFVYVVPLRDWKGPQFWHMVIANCDAQPTMWAVDCWVKAVNPGDELWQGRYSVDDQG